MKQVILILRSLIPVLAMTQEVVAVASNNYTGYIFPEEHFVWGSIENQLSRYTPTLQDIELVEKILHENLDECAASIENYDKGISKRTLKKYLRQYVGYINSDGEKVIWVNFVRNRDLKEEASKDVIEVFDGGSHFWNIKVNLTKGALYDMRVNGIA